MLEEQIHMLVVAALRRGRLYFAHVPNGSMATPGYRRKLNQLGLLKGCPDLLIFDPPPKLLRCCGSALELKTAKGVVSPAQRSCLDRLSRLGWATAVAKGYDEALDTLQNVWGYPVIG